jgi:hypothetical protein
MCKKNFYIFLFLNKLNLTHHLILSLTNQAEGAVSIPDSSGQFSRIRFLWSRWLFYFIKGLIFSYKRPLPDRGRSRVWSWKKSEKKPNILLIRQKNWKEWLEYRGVGVEKNKKKKPSWKLTLTTIAGLLWILLAKQIFFLFFKSSTISSFQVCFFFLFLTPKLAPMNPFHL